MQLIILKATRNTTKPGSDWVDVWPQGTRLVLNDDEWKEVLTKKQEDGDEEFYSKKICSLEFPEYKEQYGKPPHPGEWKIVKVTSSESLKPTSLKPRKPLLSRILKR